MIIANPLYDVVFKYKMVSRLQRAITDEEVRHIMDVEDEIERAFTRATAAKDLVIAEQEQVISEQGQVINEKEQIINEKEQVINEKEQALESERQKVADLMRRLADLEKQNKA